MDVILFLLVDFIRSDQYTSNYLNPLAKIDLIVRSII